MCEVTDKYEMVIILTLIVTFILFVVGINWWSVRDAKKTIDAVFKHN